MASFYAELHVAGHVYPVRLCTYEFTQATGARGRVVAHVRPGLVHITLDVPRDQILMMWAATAHKPLPGCLIFRNARGGAAEETLSWEAGQCVGYQEEFSSGNDQQGAYVCHLVIAAPALTMQAGGPGGYVAPAPVTHGGPQQGLVNPMVVPLLTPPTVVAPVVETVLEAATLTALAPVVLILALILGSSTPAGGPGIPQPHGRPVDPNLLRLNTLAAKHAAGTLTADEEAELIALLGKVKGIYVQRLSDLDVFGPLKGGQQPLPGFHKIKLNYTKRPDADRIALRGKFPTVRTRFLKHLANDPTKHAALRKAGLSDKQIGVMKKGVQPDGYQVHHKLPLDDGGDNSFSNLMLIKNDPWHKALTNYQNAFNKGMKPGETRPVEWPIFNGDIYP